MARILVVFLVCFIGSCNVFEEASTCSESSECREGWICDSELQACRVDEAATLCTQDNAMSQCMVGQKCTADGICVDTDYQWLVVDKSSDSKLTRLGVGVVEYVAQAMATIINERGSLSRPIVVERVRVDVENSFADLQAQQVPRLAGTFFFNTSTASLLQSAYLGSGILSLGHYTNSFDFEQNERRWNRHSFGLVPSPRADMATWSSFLSHWQPDDGLPTCRRLGFVLQKREGRDFAAEIVDTQFIRYPGLTWAMRHVIQGNVELEQEQIFSQAAEKSVDCVVVNISAEQTGLLISGHAAWRKSTGGARLRWIVLSGGVQDELFAQLQGLGLEDELVGSLIPQYGVEGAVSRELFTTLAEDYENWSKTRCVDFTADNCDVYSPEGIRVAPEGNLTLSADQAMLMSLAMIRSELRFGPRFSRQQLRDSLVSITENSARHVTCGRGINLHARLESCIVELERGRDIHYLGYSSDLVFGNDGRSSTLNEIMAIHVAEPDGSSKVLGTYVHAEMRVAYEAVNGGEL